MAAAATLLAGGAPVRAAEPVGFVAVANGDVDVQQGGAWQAATRDAQVAIGDAIRTGAGASAKIVLVDDTLLQIDEETELRIETWHVGDAATKDVSLVRQARGRLRATVGDAFGGSTRLEVHIPSAAIGIKGTDFEVVEGPVWEACLLSGGIHVTNTHGAASPAPGECLFAYADRAPGDPHPNPRIPLEVDDGGTGRKRPLATTDFTEPLQLQVAAPPELEATVEDPPQAVIPPADRPQVVLDPYDSTTGDASEDELEVFEIPDPIQNDDVVIP